MQLSEGRTRLAEVVRRHVEARYGNPTCIGCVRVLAHVLARNWSIKLSPCVVDLSVVSPEVLQISNQIELSKEQRAAQIEELPAGQRSVTMRSSKNSFNGHMIGVSCSKNGYFFWDPSIDQINENMSSKVLKPFCVELTRIERCSIEDHGFLNLPVFGCSLIYQETKHVESVVLDGEAWNLDYSSVVEAVLSEVERARASSFFE